MQPGLPPPLTKTNTLANAASDLPGHPNVSAAANDPLSAPGEEEDAAPAVDPTLDEAKAILVDYMQLLGKVVTAEAARKN